MRRVWQCLLVIGLALAACDRHPKGVADYSTQRNRMVQEQIARRGVTDIRVVAAMRKVPRDQFVPEEFRGESYNDRPLPIGYDQTISQPYIVALMTQQLKLQPENRVLEIGTGSGYQAAILAELVADVYSIEIVEPLAKKAEATLNRLGYRNVHIKTGDGYKGWVENAPFDAVIVTCAPDHVPEPLVAQLREGGRLIIPVGPRFAQELYLVRKENGQLRKVPITDVRFVPMTRESEK